jgi:peroxiredoxin
MLQEGDLAPDFALPSDSGQTVKLVNFRGKKVVLYFYPKTTRQAARRRPVASGTSTRSCRTRRPWCWASARTA